MKEKIGDAVTEIMNEKCITAAQVARDTGLSEAQVSRIKNGKLKPSLKSLLILADYFQVSTDKILGRQ